MNVKTVQLATDGVTNHLILPDGIKLNLGEVSPLKLVSAVCRDRRATRRILDAFNREGQVMLKADLDVIGPMLEPRRARIASPLMSSMSIVGPQPDASSLIEGQKRTHTRGTVMADDTDKVMKDAIVQQIDNIERMIGVLEQKAKEAAKGSLSQNMMADDIANLKAMVKDLGKAPSGQADNRAFYAAVGDQNAAVVNIALDKLRVTSDAITRLESEGRPFNAAKACEDVLAVGGGLRHVLASMDINHPEAGTEIRRLAERADRLHGLFAIAK